MSYINVSVTLQSASPPHGLGATLRAGFSREGGRLETVERTLLRSGGNGQKVEQFAPTAAMTAPARGLLDAVLGASGLRDVTMTGDLVEWFDRSGTRLGSARLREAPEAVRDVIAAAGALGAVLPDPA